LDTVAVRPGATPYVTLNAVPPAPRGDGTAVPTSPVPDRRLTKCRPLGVRLIWVVSQEPSVIDPGCPDVDSVVAKLKLVVPKLASGSVWHEPPLKQLDGASTIHSAEETSTLPCSR
jgi:hypothetical protein